ncbi:aminoglycoside phosphotransferase family protein [Gallaecimonas kandeliae]|uniref:aminoglycoside phosphotransferase family protein n=1 Tax=Gallaecimonas kandeliae TaxID=3029055 RepID=UPI002648EBFC|nr:aminoglycoside phosphotransferase family protein [Gallaecimonas kandeliae]WKE66998.1 aminoglycoside phosphotransferase family protein [Gallaecimonas kandeliae]
MTVTQSWEQGDWPASADAWVKAELEKRQIPAGMPLEAVSGWALGQILRQPTAQGDYYFKATAKLPLFSNEASLCRTLSDCFPGATPATLAIQADRQWMLSGSFGQPLAQDCDLSVWAEAFAAYGRLQSSSIPHLERLKASGCLARPVTALPERLAELFCDERLAGLLPSKALAYATETIAKVAEAIADLGRHPLPDALMHGDLHIENIARTQDGFVFFDWSDACISHPFIDGTYVYRMPEGAGKERIIDAYLGGWTAFMDKGALRQTWDRAEILCYAHQAQSYGSMMIQLPEQGRAPLKTAFENAFIRLNDKARS